MLLCSILPFSKILLHWFILPQGSILQRWNIFLQCYILPLCRALLDEFLWHYPMAPLSEMVHFTRLLRSAAFVHFSPYYIFPQWSILPLLIFAFSWPSTKILQIFLQQCKTNFYIISFFLLSKYIMQKFWNSWYCFTSSHGCWPRLSRQRGVQKWSFEIAMPLLHNLWLSTPYRHTTMSSLLTRNCKAHLRSYL